MLRFKCASDHFWTKITIERGFFNEKKHDLRYHFLCTRMLMSQIRFISFNVGLDKSKSHYESVNKKIEKISSLLYFSLVKVSTIAFVMPDFIVSFALYFSTDLGNQAFKLPFSSW